MGGLDERGQKIGQQYHRIAFDIGGVLSKYPQVLVPMMFTLGHGYEVHVITDMHDRDEVIVLLRRNGVGEGHVRDDHVHVSDYEQHGDACKAVLLRDLGIDVLVDDHPGYLVWPWPTPAPLRLRVEPDPRRPYWHPGWKCDGGEFGRRCYLGD